MNIFIVGAGYVGKALLSHLDKSKNRIFASTTSKEKIEDLQIDAQEVYVLSGTNKELLKKIIDRCEVIIVLVAPKNKETYEATYLETAHSISFALKERTTPCYLLYTSSTGVYEGQKEASWAEENVFLNPHSQKAQTLMHAEEIYLNSANQNITTCILRLGGIFGPGRELNQRALKLSGKELPGDGNEPTNHIHLMDIVFAIEFCIEQKLEGVYNLVNDEHPTRQELYTTLSNTLKIPPPHWNPKLPHQHGSNCKVSNEKIKNAGFKFFIRTSA